jgi:hypothetical protein
VINDVGLPSDILGGSFEKRKIGIDQLVYNQRQSSRNSISTSFTVRFICFQVSEYPDSLVAMETSKQYHPLLSSYSLTFVLKCRGLNSTQSIPKVIFSHFLIIT